MGIVRSIGVSVVLAVPMLATAQEPTLLDRFLLFALAEEIVDSQLLQLHDSTIRAFGAAPTPPFVRRITQRMEIALGKDLSITVVQSPTFNASAYPNGRIIINQGLLDFAKNDEDKIAAVIGHEIAHIERQHALKRFQQRLLVDAVVSGMLLGGDLEGLAPIVYGAITMRYSRDHELESDRLGFVYAVRAGYSPMAAAELWSDVNREFRSDNSLFGEMLSTHPPSEYRSRQLQKFAGAYDSGVPLDWIKAGKLTSDLYREIGAPPDVIVSESVFMNVMMNLPGSVYTNSDYPRFAISPQVDGFMAILKVSPNQEAGILMPHPYERIGRCEVGVRINVPSVEYRTPKDELVRLRWDQTGTFRYLFVLSEERIDYGSLVGEVHDLQSLKEAVGELAREQRVLLLDTAEATISVAK